jgi:AhpD family alkylhydroperoxidase
MQSRLKNPAMLVPGALQALQSFAKCVERSGLPPKTIELIHMRASQINGCGVCLDLHYTIARSKGESDERLFALAGWRDTPYFSDAERAALALTEAVTRMSDRSDPVPDAIWNEAARHYSDEALAALVLAIASINVWNRLNVTTRQVAGEWAKSDDAKKWVEEHATAAR